MDLDLRDLRYFSAIAQLGHVRRAAERVHRSQPALTKSIRRLETAFGTPLFHRVGRGIRLTPAGELLLARGSRLQTVSEDLVREIRDFAQGIGGHVRIGTTPLAADYLLPDACSLLLERAPDVTLEIFIEAQAALRDLLEAGALDLVVGQVSEGERGLFSDMAFEDVVVVVARRSHAIFRKRVRRLADLLEFRWILPSPTLGSRQWIDNAFESRGLRKPTVQIESTSVQLLPQLIARTDLLSFVSRRAIGRGRDSVLREVVVAEATMRRHYGIAYRADGYLSPAAQRLVTLLKAEGRRMRLSAPAPA